MFRSEWSTTTARVLASIAVDRLQWWIRVKRVSIDANDEATVEDRMSNEQDHRRIAWLDQYNEPDLKSLRSALNAETRQLFDDMRKGLLAFDGIKEQSRWYGDCWHWTLAYEAPGLDLPLAVLIPAPEDLKLAIPIDESFSSQISVSRMKRTVRDGFDLACEPYDTRWGVWSLVPGTLQSDLLDLAKQKLSTVKG